MCMRVEPFLCRCTTGGSCNEQTLCISVPRQLEQSAIMCSVLPIMSQPLLCAVQLLC